MAKKDKQPKTSVPTQRMRQSLTPEAIAGEEQRQPQPKMMTRPGEGAMAKNMGALSAAAAAGGAMFVYGSGAIAATVVGAPVIVTVGAIAAGVAVAAGAGFVGFKALKSIGSGVLDVRDKLWSKSPASKARKNRKEAERNEKQKAKSGKKRQKKIPLKSATQAHSEVMAYAFQLGFGEELQSLQDVNAHINERNDSVEVREGEDPAQYVVGLPVEIPEEVYTENGEIDQAKLNAYLGIKVSLDGNGQPVAHLDKDTVSPFINQAIMARAAHASSTVKSNEDHQTKDRMDYIREATQYYVKQGFITQSAADAYIASHDQFKDREQDVEKDPMRSREAQAEIIKDVEEIPMQ